MCGSTFERDITGKTQARALAARRDLSTPLVAKPGNRVRLALRE